MSNAINQRIANLCKEKGYSWYRLSALSGIPVSTIVSIINRNNAPTIPTLQKLCTALDLTLAQFFSEGFETTTETQNKYLYEFNRLDNHEQDLVLAYIQGMIDAKEARLVERARQEEKDNAAGKTKKRGGRKKKVTETPQEGPASQEQQPDAQEAQEPQFEACDAQEPQFEACNAQEPQFETCDAENPQSEASGTES